MPQQRVGAVGELLSLQECLDLPGKPVVQSHSLEILALVHVVQGGAVHRDDGIAQLHAFQQLPHGGLGLYGDDAELRPVADEAVELRLAEGGQLLLAAQQGVAEAGDKERVRVPPPGQVHPVDKLRHQDADAGVQHTVEHEEIGVGVADMVDGDAQHDHRGKVGHLGDLQQHRKIQHHARPNGGEHDDNDGTD